MTTKEVTLSSTQEAALNCLKQAIKELEQDETKRALWRAEDAVAYLETWKDVIEGRR